MPDAVKLLSNSLLPLVKFIHSFLALVKMYQPHNVLLGLWRLPEHTYIRQQPLVPGVVTAL